MEEGDTKCFVVMASKAELSQQRDARVRVLMQETLEECLMAPMEYLESVLMEEWSNDYAAWEKTGSRRSLTVGTTPDLYIRAATMCRATKSPNHSTAGNPVYTAIFEAPTRSIAIDVFAMPEVPVEGKKYDCVLSAMDRHSGCIVAVPGKKSKKKDKRDKH